MVCIRCQKRPAIIFIQRMENGQMKQEGYCLHCARELHIKPVDDLMIQFGMSEQDLDIMENRMESMMEELGDSNPLSMLMNMSGSGDVAGAVESTWAAASGQIKTVVNNVVFPAIDMILAIFFFVKLGTAYFDYRKTGQFEWTAPAILFACLVFTLTAPLYIWDIVCV